MAEEGKEEGAEQPSGGMMQKLLIGGGAIVLMVVGVVAGPAVMNLVSPPEEDPSAELEGEMENTSSKPAIYTSLHPPWK
jgi:hypothetical protein